MGTSKTERKKKKKKRKKPYINIYDYMNPCCMHVYAYMRDIQGKKAQENKRKGGNDWWVEVEPGFRALWRESPYSEWWGWLVRVWLYGTRFLFGFLPKRVRGSDFYVRVLSFNGELPSYFYDNFALYFYSNHTFLPCGAMGILTCKYLVYFLMFSHFLKYRFFWFLICEVSTKL